MFKDIPNSVFRKEHSTIKELAQALMSYIKTAHNGVSFKVGNKSHKGTEVAIDYLVPLSSADQTHQNSIRLIAADTSIHLVKIRNLNP